jgi:hypothetical protein
MFNNRYTRLRTLRESNALIDGARNLEQQAAGWKLFFWFAGFVAFFAYLLARFIGWALG